MKLKFFNLAKESSTKSSYHHKIGAVLVYKGKILSIGHNKPEKTHPKSNNPFKTVHAELDVILSSGSRDLSGTTLYLYREYKNGYPACAKPCEYCMKLISKYKIKKVYYTDEGKYKQLNFGVSNGLAQ